MTERLQQYILEIKSAIQEVRTSIHTQLVFGVEKSPEIAKKYLPLLDVMREVLFRKLDMKELFKLVAEHLIAVEVCRIGKQDCNNLFENILYNNFKQLSDELLSSTKQQELLKSLSILLQNLEETTLTEENREQVLADILIEEKNEMLPSYFNGFLNNLFRIHFGRPIKKDDQFLFPSFSIPAFFTHLSEKNTFFCNDLIVYYWSLCHQPYTQICFGNALSFYDFRRTGNQQSLYTDRHKNLEHISQVLSTPVNVILGVQKELSKANRAVHPNLFKEVKKNFPDGLHRNPLSFWLQWVKEKLYQGGLFILRGDISLAKDEQLLEWRKSVESFCSDIYIQTDNATDEVLYCFVFKPSTQTATSSKVFFSYSYMEDFEEVPKEGNNWITIPSMDYNDFLPLYHEKDESIFNEKANGLQIQQKSWLMDFDRTTLQNKVNHFLAKEQQLPNNTLRFEKKKQTFNKAFLQRVTVKPFIKKWIYLDTESNIGNISGVLPDEKMLAVWTNKENFSVHVTNGLTLSEYFDKSIKGYFLPLKHSNQNNKESYNISDWALKQFKQKYGKNINNINELDLSSEDIKWFENKLEKLSKHTFRLPVIHKFTERLQESIGSLEEEDTVYLFEKCRVYISQFETKLKILQKGASERKKMLEEIKLILNDISTQLYELDKHRIEAIQKDKEITKENIFYYTLAILHHPEYQQKFKSELQAVTPRIPLLNDFWQWYKVGENIATIYLNKETISPYPLTIEQEEDNKSTYKVKNHKLYLDNGNVVSDFPYIFWDFKLAGQHPIPMILQQYKERKPLNKDLLTFFKDEITELQQNEILRIIQQLVQVQLTLDELLELPLFNQVKAVATLKKRI